MLYLNISKLKRLSLQLKDIISKIKKIENIKDISSFIYLHVCILEFDIRDTKDPIRLEKK
jgi:hypothetical protein